MSADSRAHDKNYLGSNLGQTLYRNYFMDRTRPGNFGEIQMLSESNFESRGFERVRGHFPLVEVDFSR